MLFAQNQRFQAGFLIGVNASQIDGDASAGFNKLGLTGGVRGATILNEKASITTDILFSQRGSQLQFLSSNSINQFKINLNYVEVPLAFHYRDWKDLERGFYRIQFFGGFSYARLVSASSENTPFDGKTEDIFKKNDMSWLIGTTFFLREKTALSFRYTRSMNYLFNPKTNTTINARALLSYFISFNLIYLL